MTAPTSGYVLAGVDGSPRSTPVLRWADAQARRTGARVVALFAGGTEPGESQWPDAAAEATARRRLAAAVTEALPEDRAAEVELRVEPLPPEEALAGAAPSARLVVLGVHHVRPLHPLGSVTARVIAATRQPVVVIRDLPAAATGRISVGVDGSPGARPGLAWAVAQARLTGATVDAVLAWEWQPEYSVYPYGEDVDRVRGERAEVLAAELARLPPEDRPLVDGRLVEGHPVHVLLEAGAAADLLVIGVDGRRGVADRLLGSVSQRLVRHAPVPVVVVRAPHPGGPGAGSAAP